MLHRRVLSPPPALRYAIRTALHRLPNATLLALRYTVAFPMPYRCRLPDAAATFPPFFYTYTLPALRYAVACHKNILC
jgi:hypothetical protein